MIRTTLQLDTGLLIGGAFELRQEPGGKVLTSRTGGLIPDPAEVSTEQVDRAVAAAGATAIRLHPGQHPCHLIDGIPHGGLARSGHGKDLSAYAPEDCGVLRHVMARRG